MKNNLKRMMLFKIGLGFCIITGICFVGCKSKKVGDVFEVRLASQMPVGHHITESLDLFCKRANELSDGRLEIKHYPAGQLMVDKEIPKAISSGTVEMAQTFLPWWKGMLTTISPYSGISYESLQHYLKIARGPLFEYQDKLLEEKANCKLIGAILYTASAGTISKKPIRKETGFQKGMKIRIPSKTGAAEVKALGGAPVVLSSADVYMALQRGTIDGATSGVTSFFARKWYEVAKNILIIRPTMTDFHIVANLEWYNKLPEDLKKILKSASKEASEYCTKKVQAQEGKVFEALKAKGVNVYQVSKKDYKAHWGPRIEPALRAMALQELGKDLVLKYETWLKQTK